MSKMFEELLDSLRTAENRIKEDDSDTVAMLCHVEVAIYVVGVALLTVLEKKPSSNEKKQESKETGPTTGDWPPRFVP